MKVKTLGTCVALLFAAFVHADIIVQPVDAVQAGGGTPHQSSLDNSWNGSGLASPLNGGDPVPGTLPTHSSNYTLGTRWLGGQWPTAVTFDLGAPQADPIHSVILYNYNEFGGSLTRGLSSVDVLWSTDGENFFLAQDNLAFAQAGLSGSNDTLAQTVDLVSPTPAGVTHIRFQDLQSHGDAIVGLGEVRFTSIPEPGALGLLGLGAGLLIFLRRDRMR